MTQVVLHLGKEYIDEDLEYYFSDERDKNNQIRPDEKIYSLTPSADHIDIDLNDGNVGNFFYPLAPNLLDRIYIGISVSLFANHWGASFLLELMKQIKPDGAIILPVYPEGQAAEKNFWSRSFLENIFLSRSRWKGISNINAENDGVMSLKIGRKWPDPIPSTIEWFYRERSNLMLTSLLAKDSEIDSKTYLTNAFVSLCNLIWLEYTRSAIVERIITDHFDPKKALSLLHIGREYGLLANDLMLSQFVNVQQGTSWHIGEAESLILESVSQYFAPLSNHILKQSSALPDLEQDSADAIIISDQYLEVGEAPYKKLLEQAWMQLPANGLLIVHEQLETHDDIAQLDSLLSALGQLKYYSSIAACEIKPEVEISQYSLAVEENLRQEKKNKSNVFRVLQKSH